MSMITMAGIRNSLWCALAFAIVACASAQQPDVALPPQPDVASGSAAVATPTLQADASPASLETAGTLSGSQVVPTERGLLLTLADGTFDSNRAVLKPDARRGLDALAKFLRDNPGRRVQIEAFTDAEGASVYNLELSQDRADAVALAVIDDGVDPARVRAMGWGERFPVAGNDTEASRQRNRRVEITISKGDAAVPVRVVNAP